MAETTIEWAHYTFNPWVGCTKVSPACKNCYAERDFDLRRGFAKWGDAGTRVMTASSNWKKPLLWDNAAQTVGERKRVFCASLADVFEDWQGEIRDSHGEQMLVCPNGHIDSDLWGSEPRHIPCSSECGEAMRSMTMDDVRVRLFKLIDATPNLDWLLLTKRPENIGRMWPKVKSRTIQGVKGKDGETYFPMRMLGGDYRHNVWIGTSVENQKCLESRLPEIEGTKDLCPVRFLSCEPLLGRLDFSMRTDGTGSALTAAGIDWVIAGGESGPEARPSNPDWFRDLRDQCAAANVPFHFKQWGEWREYHDTDDSLWSVFGRSDHHAFDEETVVHRIGKKNAGRLLDGALYDEFPCVRVPQ